MEPAAGDGTGFDFYVHGPGGAVESFSYPLIIMLTLPLSIPFALFSLWITGRALSLWSALGMFLLLGIVKKKGILQVDYTNRLIAERMPVREATWKQTGSDYDRS